MSKGNHVVHFNHSFNLYRSDDSGHQLLKGSKITVETILSAALPKGILINVGQIRTSSFKRFVKRLGKSLFWTFIVVAVIGILSYSEKLTAGRSDAHVKNSRSILSMLSSIIFKK